MSIIQPHRPSDEALAAVAAMERCPDGHTCFTDACRNPYCQERMWTLAKWLEVAANAPEGDGEVTDRADIAALRLAWYLESRERKAYWAAVDRERIVREKGANHA